MKILFEDNYNPNLGDIKTFSVGNSVRSDVFGSDSQEFKDLKKIHSYEKLDLKSVIGAKNNLYREKVLSLLME